VVKFWLQTTNRRSARIRCSKPAKTCACPVLTRAVGLILTDPQQTWKIIAPGVGLLAIAYVLQAMLGRAPSNGSPIDATRALAIAILSLCATIMIIVN
jgi:Na+-transporting NADH:ubiquinone oxidoreductase subunit NqrB